MAYDEIKLSIILVHHAGNIFLETCLLSVQSAVSGWDAEVIVVDNHSADNLLIGLRSRFPEVKFVELVERVSLGKAYNQAIRQCAGQYVLLLSPATLVGEESLRSLCFLLDDAPRVGVVGVKMIDGQGLYLPDSQRSFPTPWSSFWGHLGFPEPDLDSQHEVALLGKAFMLVRHEALDKIGLFDEEFFTHGEELDFSYRLLQAGYQSLYVPERLLRFHGENTQNALPEEIRAYYEGLSLFCQRYHPASSWWAVPLLRIASTLKIGWARLLGEPGRKRRKLRKRRVLILCDSAHLEEVRQACTRTIHRVEFVNHWNLDEERLMSAICRKNQMRGFTDYVFCHPDARYEQILLFMDQMPNKQLFYHIYSRKNGRLVLLGQ